MRRKTPRMKSLQVKAGVPILWAHTGKEIQLAVRGFVCAECGKERVPVGRCEHCHSFADVAVNLMPKPV